MEQTQKIHLFDTTIFVDHLRGNTTKASQWIEEAFSGYIEAGVSTITDLELWIGVNSKENERRHKILLSKFRRFQLNVTIARRAGQLYRPYKLANDKSISIPDFIIAATAEYYKANIVTRNAKDFRPLQLKNVKIIEYF